MNKVSQPIGEVGVLRHSYKMEEGDDFIARFLMGLGGIRSCAYGREKHLEYDKSFDTVFQNLLEAKLAKDKCETLMSRHRQDILEGKDGIFSGHQIDIKNPIDDDLNLYFKDFFIRGVMAIDCLIRHTAFMGYNVRFLFYDDDDKKQKKGLANFPLKSDDPRFAALADMIKHNKTNWYSQFLDLRRKIEHEGFKLPQLKYPMKNGKVEPIFPTFPKQTIEEVMKICWESLTVLCEEILVLLLSLKLKDPMVIVRIPESMRDKNLPVRYKVGHKDFPMAHMSC